jgi:hypothetical protein
VFIDVVVSNAPSAFGFIENPDIAHRVDLDNPAVQRLIVCGTDGCP